MANVTRNMISAAHGVTIASGDVILSAELLTRIYQAMHAQSPQHHVSWSCPVCAASVEPNKNDAAKHLEALGYALCQIQKIAKRPKDESAFIAFSTLSEIRKQWGIGVTGDE